MFESYSVLMSVYYKEKPDYLRESMLSMFNQTVTTDDFVLVCDGPLNDRLNQIIEEMQEVHPELNVIRLEKNVGLGNALNVGMKYCKNELIARMDSDDISYIDRCEKQLRVFEELPSISICGGTVEEFDRDVNNIEARRILPERNWQIITYAKKRNPFNHPCVMYKKTDVMAADGYKDFFLLEDYYLWIRMLLLDCQGYNIQEPILCMRAGSDLYRRRGGWKYAKMQLKLFGYMKNTGFINQIEYSKAALLRVVGSMLPNFIREFIYRKLLRKIRM